jgi:hypothetical protein
LDATTTAGAASDRKVRVAFPTVRRPPLAALLLGLLLVSMAAGQLADVTGFEAILADYELGGRAEGVAAVAVPIAELVAAAGLLVSSRVGGILGLAVAAFWSALAAQAFARGLELPNCGCFGVYLGQELRWWVLLQDVYFVALAWLAAVSVGVALPASRLRATTTP